MRTVVLIVWVMMGILPVIGGDYSFKECEGSLTPYPDVRQVAKYPDSLEAVMVNHVGRHGARYPASDTHCKQLQDALARAERAGTLTNLGRKLKKLNNRVIALSKGRWGALDSLGVAEQRGIARRMMESYGEVFKPGRQVTAISSYSPRVIASMDAFLLEMAEQNKNLNFSTTAGRENNYLVRPFDVDKAYLDFRKDELWEPPYSVYYNATAPTAPIRRVMGEKFRFKNEAEARELSLIEYYVLAGLQAMGEESRMADFMTLEEANELWSCFNLRQYLQRTATDVSAVPAEIAIPLLKNMIEAIDGYIASPETSPVASLRFGHAETLMPLLSLMALPGCRYLTRDYATVADHWRDFQVVPMAANLQMILFRAKGSGRYYVMLEHNEQVVSLPASGGKDFIEWEELKGILNDAIVRGL